MGGVTAHMQILGKVYGVGVHMCHVKRAAEN